MTHAHRSQNKPSPHHKKRKYQHSTHHTASKKRRFDTEEPQHPTFENAFAEQTREYLFSDLFGRRERNFVKVPESGENAAIDSPRIMVYWDMTVNHAKMNTNDMIRVLHAFARRFGSVIGFKVYLDEEERDLSRVLSKFVQFITVPSMDRSICTNAMLVDMALQTGSFGQMRPSRDIFVLVSSDGDFAPSNAALRRLGYDVIVLSFVESHTVSSMCQLMDSCSRFFIVKEDRFFNVPTTNDNILMLRNRISFPTRQAESMDGVRANISVPTPTMTPSVRVHSKDEDHKNAPNSCAKPPPLRTTPISVSRSRVVQQGRNRESRNSKTVHSKKTPKLPKGAGSAPAYDGKTKDEIREDKKTHPEIPAQSPRKSSPAKERKEEPVAAPSAPVAHVRDTTASEPRKSVQSYIVELPLDVFVKNPPRLSKHATVEPSLPGPNSGENSTGPVATPQKQSKLPNGVVGSEEPVKTDVPSDDNLLRDPMTQKSERSPKGAAIENMEPTHKLEGSKKPETRKKPARKPKGAGNKSTEPVQNDGDMKEEKTSKMQSKLQKGAASENSGFMQGASQREDAVLTSESTSKKPARLPKGAVIESTERVHEEPGPIHEEVGATSVEKPRKPARLPKGAVVESTEPVHEVQGSTHGESKKKPARLPKGAVIESTESVRDAGNVSMGETPKRPSRLPKGAEIEISQHHDAVVTSASSPKPARLPKGAVVERTDPVYETKDELQKRPARLPKGAEVESTVPVHEGNLEIVDGPPKKQVRLPRGVEQQ